MQGGERNTGEFRENLNLNDEAVVVESPIN
jgi:hypothetical protein